jgi:hypothetical protein
MTRIHGTLGCGERAAGQLAPYDPAISANFEIPVHIGKLIASWDRPAFVDADKADHMREDDYVVGIVHKGKARAYPLWITDNYHMINDKLAGGPVLFSTCERCQSGSAFISKVDGQAVKFSAMGMHNASLTMINRKRSKGDQHSLWLHYEGVAIDGPRKGEFLEQIPSYHTTWRAWVAGHPQTDVMLAPDDPHHRDARHGHGREEYFSRPGMDQPLAKTITGHFDDRYPENEMVLGINIDAGIRAYPLLEIKREGGVLNDTLGDQPILILSGPRPEQVTMSAFSRTLDERILSFESYEGQFHDHETKTRWTIEGLAVAGPLKGKQLLPLRWQYVRWHAWVYPHPDTELFVSAGPLPQFPAFPTNTQVTALQDILAQLHALESDLRLSHVIAELALPHKATQGLCVYAGDDRINLYAFTSPDAAHDYVELQGAWFCVPFDTKLARKRALRLNSFVLESDPTHQYADPTQIIHYPDNETPWSKLISRSELISASKTPAQGHYLPLIHHLKQQRFDVVECAFLPHSQLRVGTLSAIAATIEADRFAIYRCTDEAAAIRVAREVTHAIAVGPWVFRSIPVLMYADPHYEMGQLPDEKITWSPLLRNDSFLNALEDFIGGPPKK